VRLTFCAVCGRIALKGFVFCPYCGSALQPGPGLDSAASKPFMKLESMQAEYRARHIDEMLELLEGLEADVEEIMHHTASSS
jgi:hypothetical protein